MFIFSLSIPFRQDPNLMKALSIKQEDHFLRFEYEPLTDRAIFDICDLNGKVMRTGTLDNPTTEIDISGFQEGEYLLLVLDGEKVVKQKVRIGQE